MSGESKVLFKRFQRLLVFTQHFMLFHGVPHVLHPSSGGSMVDRRKGGVAAHQPRVLALDLPIQIGTAEGLDEKPVLIVDRPLFGAAGKNVHKPWRGDPIVIHALVKEDRQSANAIGSQPVEQGRLQR
jgi:hypothetical protein